MAQMRSRSSRAVQELSGPGEPGRPQGWPHDSGRFRAGGVTLRPCASAWRCACRQRHSWPEDVRGRDLSLEKQLGLRGLGPQRSGTGAAALVQLSRDSGCEAGCQEVCIHCLTVIPAAKPSAEGRLGQAEQAWDGSANNPVSGSVQRSCRAGAARCNDLLSRHRRTASGPPQGADHRPDPCGGTRLQPAKGLANSSTRATTRP